MYTVSAAPPSAQLSPTSRGVQPAPRGPAPRGMRAQSGSTTSQLMKTMESAQ